VIGGVEDVMNISHMNGGVEIVKDKNKVSNFIKVSYNFKDRDRLNSNYIRLGD
jgi:hypothetical protein